MSTHGGEKKISIKLYSRKSVGRFFGIPFPGVAIQITQKYKRNIEGLRTEYSIHNERAIHSSDK